MRVLRTLAFVSLGALALSSCTLVSPNAKPVRIARSSVGYELLNRTIPGTNGARVRFITQPVYIVDASDNLAPSSRIVPSPPQLSMVIEQLLLGPTSIEKSAGYSSALPQKLVLVSAVIRARIGHINFATSLSSLPRTQQLLAVGQLVLTAYDVGATRGIVIKVAGVVRHLLTPNGGQTVLATETQYQTLLNN